MHKVFIDYISSKISIQLKASEEQLLSQTFVSKKLRKHQYLLQEGDVCRFAGFIVKGAFKQYTVDKTGKENILGLYIERWWVGDRESFMVGTPSPYFIEALEEVEMLIVSREDFIDKLSGQPFINEMIKRIQAAQTLSAEERYEDFQKKYPEFLQRFPQHIIASYLGMTKETLSRIRAGSTKK